MGCCDGPVPNVLIWWGYIDNNRRLHVERWYDGSLEYKRACSDKSMALRVFHPFVAATYEDAERQMR